MGSERLLTTQVESRNGVTRVALSGELDMATAPKLTAQLREFETERDGLVLLDLRDLRSIDSTGLQALLEAHARSKTNGHRLMLMGANRTVRRVFEVTRKQSLLNEKDILLALDRFLGDLPRPAGRSESAEAWIDV